MASGASEFVIACQGHARSALRVEPPLALAEVVPPAHSDEPRLELVNRSSGPVRVRLRGPSGSFVTEEVPAGETRDFAYPDPGAYVVDVVAARTAGIAVLAGPIHQRVQSGMIYPIIVEE